MSHQQPQRSHASYQHLSGRRMAPNPALEDSFRPQIIPRGPENVAGMPNGQYGMQPSAMIGASMVGPQYGQMHAPNPMMVPQFTGGYQQGGQGGQAPQSQRQGNLPTSPEMLAYLQQQKQMPKIMYTEEGSNYSNSSLDDVAYQGHVHVNKGMPNVQGMTPDQMKGMLGELLQKRDVIMQSQQQQIGILQMNQGRMRQDELQQKYQGILEHHQGPLQQIQSQIDTLQRMISINMGSHPQQGAMMVGGGGRPNTGNMPQQMPQMPHAYPPPHHMMSSPSQHAQYAQHAQHMPYPQDRIHPHHRQYPQQRPNPQVSPQSRMMPQPMMPQPMMSPRQMAQRQQGQQMQQGQHFQQGQHMQQGQQEGSTGVPSVLNILKPLLSPKGAANTNNVVSSSPRLVPSSPSSQNNKSSSSNMVPYSPRGTQRVGISDEEKMKMATIQNKFLQTHGDSLQMARMRPGYRPPALTLFIRLFSRGCIILFEQILLSPYANEVLAAMNIQILNDVNLPPPHIKSIPSLSQNVVSGQKMQVTVFVGDDIRKFLMALEKKLVQQKPVQGYTKSSFDTLEYKNRPATPLMRPGQMPPPVMGGPGGILPQGYDMSRLPPAYQAQIMQQQQMMMGLGRKPEQNMSQHLAHGGYMPYDPLHAGSSFQMMAGGGGPGGPGGSAQDFFQSQMSNPIFGQIGMNEIGPDRYTGTVSIDDEYVAPHQVDQDEYNTQWYADRRKGNEYLGHQTRDPGQAGQWRFESFQKGGVGKNVVYDNSERPALRSDDLMNIPREIADADGAEAVDFVAHGTSVFDPYGLSNELQRRGGNVKEEEVSMQTSYILENALAKRYSELPPALAQRMMQHQMQTSEGGPLMVPNANEEIPLPVGEFNRIPM